MKLVIAIVRHKDANKLIYVLTEDGFRVTKLASTGGFLRAGNTTIFVGVEAEKVDKVLYRIEEICKTREEELQTVTYSIIESTGVYNPYLPEIKVQEGGATIFVVDVDKFIKI